MTVQYLLTLLLLFLAPHLDALDPVLDKDERWKCSDQYWWGEREPDYYDWEWCLFDYSGTYDNDEKLDRDDHQALYERVWADYVGSIAPAPKLRRGETAVSEVCGGEESRGCFDVEQEVCSVWRMCLKWETATIAVRDRHERLLLHEVAHAVEDALTWSSYWGEVSRGTTGQPPGTDPCSAVYCSKSTTNTPMTWLTMPI